MEKRTLGRSGIEISALGFGCWPIGGLIIEDGKSVGWGAVDDAESIRAVQRAIDLGVTYFDTAEVYGRSEDILGQAFEGRRDQVVIATKFGRAYNRDKHEIIGPDTRVESMRRSLEGSLRRLKTDHIDLYQLHLGDCPAPEAIALREGLEVLVHEGKIRAYGWSTDNLENLKLFAQGPHCAAVQQHFNIFDGNQEILAFCEAQNLASVNRGPLAMGLLTGKYDLNATQTVDDVRGAGHDWMWLFPNGQPNREYLNKLGAIREILTSKGRTLTQGALAWLWGRSEKTIPIPGFKGMKQAEENARSMEFGPLLPGQMAEIKAILEGLKPT